MTWNAHESRSTPLERGVHVLQAFRPAGGTLRLAEIARRTGLPKSTVHRGDGKNGLAEVDRLIGVGEQLGQEAHPDRQPRRYQQAGEQVTAQSVGAQRIACRGRQIRRSRKRDCLGCADRRVADEPEQQHTANQCEANSDPWILAQEAQHFQHVRSPFVVSNAWIEKWVHEIQQQRGQSDTYDDEKDNPVDGEVVEATNGTEKYSAHPCIVEDNLDEQCTRQDSSE